MQAGRVARIPEEATPPHMTIRAIRPETTGEKPLHTVPLYLVSQLVELVGRWHIPGEELLSETGLTRQALQDPFGRFPVPKMCNLLERARHLTGEPGLGYYDGLQKRASAYGTLGFAALSASSVREALEIAVKFAPVFSTALSLDLRVEGDRATLRLEQNADLGGARDVVIISMMLGMQTMFGGLTGRPQDGSADLAIAEPPYQSRFAHLVPKWRFGQPHRSRAPLARTGRGWFPNARRGGCPHSRLGANAEAAARGERRLVFDARRARTVRAGDDPFAIVPPVDRRGRRSSRLRNRVDFRSCVPPVDRDDARGLPPHD